LDASRAAAIDAPVVEDRPDHDNRAIPIPACSNSKSLAPHDLLGQAFGIACVWITGKPDLLTVPHQPWYCSSLTFSIHSTTFPSSFS
jgi:hypothetical protein